MFKEKGKAENNIRSMSLINGKYLNGVCFMKDLLLLIEMTQFTFVYEQFFRTILRHLRSTLNLFVGSLKLYILYIVT